MDKTKEIINAVFWGIVAAGGSMTLAGLLSTMSNDAYISSMAAVFYAVIILIGAVVTCTILLLRIKE